MLPEVEQVCQEGLKEEGKPTALICCVQYGLRLSELWSEVKIELLHSHLVCACGLADLSSMSTLCFLSLARGGLTGSSVWTHVNAKLLSNRCRPDHNQSETELSLSNMCVLA